MMLSPHERGPKPRIGAASPNSCQISSVMNGTIGCNSRTSVSSTWAKIRCAAGRDAAVLQPRLHHLDIKTAELVPGEVVQAAGRRRRSEIARAPPSLGPVTVASRLRIQRSSIAKCR